MPKHPLLPDNYQDSLTQTVIMYALKPYENAGAGAGIINPKIKWDLNSAWEAAEELLPHTQWKPISGDTECELDANSETEVERINALIAGLVAYQIMYPDEKILLRRIEHKRGGEVDLVISRFVADKLKSKFPTLLLPGEKRKSEFNVSTGDGLVKNLLGKIRQKFHKV